MATWTMRAAGLRRCWPEGPGTYTEDDFRCEPEAVVLSRGWGAIGEQGKPAGKLAVWSVIGELEAAGDREGQLRAGLARAHDAVDRLSLAWGGLSRPWATVAAVCRDGDSVLVAHVGDCRISQWSDGRLAPVTVDHTLATEFPELPSTPEYYGPTRAVGRTADRAIPDVARLEAHGGERYLLATPSIHRALGDDALASLLGDDLDAACARVLTAVEASAPHGTATICLVHLDPAAPAATTSGASTRPARSWLFAPGSALPPPPPRYAQGAEVHGPDSQWFADVHRLVMGDD